MGQITTGIGLVSGIDIASIVDQLIAVESRPKQLVEQRNAILQAQQVAYNDINAKLLVLNLSATALTRETTFTPTASTSSNEAVLTGTSSASSIPGSYNFIVDRLVSTQQLITQGFADSDQTPVGEGTLTFEFGDAALTSNTELALLNGGQGVQRGEIRITDRSGASAVIDLSRALTVNDVLDEINSAAGISVSASVDGDGFVLTDNTGSTAQNLVVTDLGFSGTATALGLTGSVASSTLTGAQVNTVGESTKLSALNDGNGVRFLDSQDDFQIVQRDGTTVNVDIAGSQSLGDVIDAINTASGGTVTATVNSSGTGLALVDNTSGGTTTQVLALNGSNAAADLGILQTDADNDGTLDGDRVIATLNSRLLSSLNGGSGLTQDFALGSSVLRTTTLLDDLFNGAGIGSNGTTANDLRIFARDTSATSYQIDVDALTTVDDLINAFDSATGGRVTLSISGNQLVATDNTGGSSNFAIIDLSGSSVAADLGIAVSGAVDSVTGVDTNPTPDVLSTSGPGEISFTTRDGATNVVDINGARTVDQLLSAINDAGIGITASINSAGNGLLITDTTGGTGDLVIADSGSTTAATELGIAGTYQDDQVNSGNLQLQYISEATKLAALRGGQGINRGTFTITDSNGDSATVDLTQGDELTVGDVIQEINSRGLAINARINDTGDGLLIEDTGSGIVTLKIEDTNGTSARELGIAGEAEVIGDSIDGSFERTVEVVNGATLEDVVNAIDDADLGISATIINDGSSDSPFRLSLVSTEAGKAGAFVFDDGGLGFNPIQLSEAKNALVFYGSNNAASGIAITSATNTLASVIPGSTISLHSASETPVQLNISRNDQAVADAVSKLVTDFNAVIETLDRYDTYNQETEERGLLLGDSTVAQVRSSLYRLVNARNNDVTGQFNALVQVGVTVGSGATLQLDQEKLLAALSTNRESVLEFFTFKEEEENPDTEETELVAGGFGVRFQDLIATITDAENGIVQRRIDGVDRQIQLNDSRVDDLDQRLEQKRARLEAQFFAMEQALAQLQGQSSSLNTLAQLASQASIF